MLELTGTAARGGQVAWMFRLMQVSFHVALRNVRNREAILAFTKYLALPPLWLAREVQIQDLEKPERFVVGSDMAARVEWQTSHGNTVLAFAAVVS